MASQDARHEELSEMRAISQAINYLGLQLYQELSKEMTNAFFSPLSLSTALSMLFCGSSGATSEEMRHILGYEKANIPDKDVHHYFQLLLRALDEIPNSYTLTSANVVFGQRDFLIKDKFKDLLEKSFKAMILQIDFCSDSSKGIQQVNDWVKEKTKGLIPQILYSLNPTTVMILLNAVYFKGFWMHPFAKYLTYLQTFYNNGLESNAKKVEMMHLEESFPVAEMKSFKVIQLPYKGGEIAMLIILPNSRNGLEELESQLSSNFLADLQIQLSEKRVKIALPKFRLEYSKHMKRYLQNFGMNGMFSHGANFEGISDSNEFFVSEIFHKAVLVVNEKGSEAAAVTDVEKVCDYGLDLDFIVDHPFMFLIYNFKTNLILFMGKVHEL